jgi:hypothetical protein
MTLALAGLFAGLVHVLSGPDHLAAIAPYAVEGKAGAWRTGVRWGLGHSAGVIAVGLLALLLREALHVEALSAWGERCVGVVLIAVGVRGIGAALALARRPGEPQRHGAHRHAPFAIGTVHGLAGSSHLLGIAPALVLPSDLAVSAYLLLFGLGSIAAMGMFASLVGWLAGPRLASGVLTQSTLLALSSVIAVVVGGFWLFSESWFTPSTAALI